MPNARHITVQVPADVYEALRKIGLTAQRSISAEVRHALALYTEPYRKFNKDTTP